MSERHEDSVLQDVHDALVSTDSTMGADNREGRGNTAGTEPGVDVADARPARIIMFVNQRFICEFIR